MANGLVHNRTRHLLFLPRQVHAGVVGAAVGVRGRCWDGGSVPVATA